jgi:hypothetical protein
MVKVKTYLAVCGWVLNIHVGCSAPKGFLPHYQTCPPYSDLSSEGLHATLYSTVVTVAETVE